MYKAKKVWKIFLATILLLFVISSFTFAEEGTVFKENMISDEQVKVALTEKVKGPAFYAGEIIQIDGLIDGTVFAAGRKVRVNGEIQGDLITAAQEITVNGKIAGNIYSAAQEIYFSGEIKGDAFGAAQRVEISKDANFSRDVIVAANKIIQFGQIERQLFAAGKDISLNGFVGDDVKVSAERLEIQQQATIDGQLLYESSREALIAPQAVIKGITEWKKIIPRTHHPEKNIGNKLFLMLISLASSLLIWFVVKILRPHFWQKTVQSFCDKPLYTIGIGALAFIVTPIAVVLFMITLVGLPLGILLGIFYAIALYLAKIIVAVSIGNWLAQRFSWPQVHQGVWLVLLGLAILAFVTKIPILGFVIQLFILFIGLGTLLFTYGIPNPKEVTE